MGPSPKPGHVNSEGGSLQKIGDYWVPDIDMRRFRNRRKTLANYSNGGRGNQIHHLEQAIAVLTEKLGAGTLGASTAIDAGANVGAYSRLMAAHFNSVHAFELAPDTFDCLQRNVQEWKLAGQITVHHNAISDAESKVGVGSGGLFRRSISREVKGSGTIQAISLDSLNLENVSFLKLDIEGHELKALMGAETLLSTSRPYVMMELKERNVQKGNADMRAHEYLLSLGYTVTADLGTPVLDRLYAPSPNA